MEQDGNQRPTERKSQLRWAVNRFALGEWEQYLANIESALESGAITRKVASQTLSDLIVDVRNAFVLKKYLFDQLDPSVQTELHAHKERIIEAIFQCADQHRIEITPENSGHQSSNRTPKPRTR